MDLSLNLRAVISQRLIKNRVGGRSAAVEVMLGTPRIKDLIRQGEVALIKEAMEQDSGEGMVSFDQALLALYKADQIAEDEALRNADSENNLRLAINLVQKERQGLGSGSWELAPDSEVDPGRQLR